MGKEIRDAFIKRMLIPGRTDPTTKKTTAGVYV